MSDESMMSENNITFAARVEDHTEEFFKHFDTLVEKVAKNAEKGFGTVDSSVENVGATIGVVSGVVSALTTKLLDYATKLVNGFIAMAQQAEQVAEKVESISTSLELVGGNAGISMLNLKGLSDAMQEVGLSTSESRQSLLKMIESEFDLKRSSELAQVAVNASAIGNVTSLQAMERMMQSVTYQSPKLLKSLGMVVDYQAEFKKASAELGRELSDTEKKQIALNAVLEEGKKIEGAYAASLETATGQRKLQADLIEKIQEQFGKLFTGAQYETLKAANDVLTQIFEFLKENEDTIDELGADFASLTKSVIYLVSELLHVAEVFKLTPIGVAIEQYTELRDTLGQDSSAFGILSEAITAGTQVMAMAAGGVTVVIQALTNLQTVISATSKYGMGLISEDELMKIKRELPSLAEEANKTFLAVSSPLLNHKTTLDNVTEATDNLTDANKKLADSLTAKLASAVADADSKLKKLRDNQDMAAAERAIDAQREAIEDALKLQWDKEDQERSHNERIQSILDKANDEKAQASQRAADDRLDIESDYYRRLQQLLEDFNYESSELARKRDAIGMLSLARKYGKDLSDEKKAQDDRRAEVSKNYEESLKELDKTTKEQLDKADQARDKELEAYQRNLDRQKELKSLHDQWEQEDRDRVMKNTLEQMVNEFQAMDGMTQAGLNNLLLGWSSYFVQLKDMVAVNSADIVGMYGGISGTASSVFNTMVGPVQVNRSAKKSLSNVKGQAGLVSDLLTPESMKSAAGIGQIPSVVPSSVNYDRRDIRVTVDGNGLSPYIQRKVAATITEIERNRE